MYTDSVIKKLKNAIKRVSPYYCKNKQKCRHKKVNK